MAIDFFKADCIAETKEKLFGIYDIPPATLDFTDAERWVAWVENDNEREINFTAIDKCLEIPRAEGKRCEALMTYLDAIVFIELKDRDGGRWAGESRDQLVNSIRLFNRDADMTPYRRRYAHISNRQRPTFRSGGMRFFQEFEDETGFILRVSDVIKVE